MTHPYSNTLKGTNESDGNNYNIALYDQNGKIVFYLWAFDSLENNC